ncbi:hypothetical protein [Luteimicrobium sp. DT211]|uniref:hypothetical protein n=1 Tax=Luteimicrobium sp. DT211 TaxID=3393412 RepID=UPI003CECE398
MGVDADAWAAERDEARTAAIEADYDLADLLPTPAEVDGDAAMYAARMVADPWLDPWGAESNATW